MKTWTRMPVFRIFLPFAAGILIGFEEYFRLSNVIILFTCGSLISLLFTVRRFATGRHATRWLAGIPWTFTWLTGGILTSGLFISTQTDWKGKEIDSMLAVVADHPKWYEHGVRFPARVIGIMHDTAQQASDFKLMVSVRNCAETSMKPGDLLWVKGTPQEIPAAGLPGEFNYRSYLLKKGIRCRVATDSSGIKLLKSGYDVPARHIAADVRADLANMLQLLLPDSATLGITSALVLGDERWLEDTVEQGYAGAGVLHVLCVSGMHVVLLLSIVEKLLSVMKLPTRIKRYRYPALILLTWYYTSLTGFTPSIVRAAMMMTLVLAGKMLNRPSNLPNMLAGCVMVLVIFDPSYLVNAGFQLSFLAVGGIVFIHDRLRWLFEPSTKAGKWTWELVSVSLAAQLATFPLSMYYFHQFPNYFLLANLIIVPVSTLVLYLGMVLLTVSWIPDAASVIAWILSKTVSFLNGTAMWIASMPHSVTYDLYITLWELLLLTAIVFTWFMINRGADKTRWFTALVLINGLVALRILTELSIHNRSALVLAGAGNSVTLGVMSGRSGVVLSSEDSSGSDRRIMSYMNSRYVAHIQNLKMPQNGYAILKTGERKMLLVQEADWRTAKQVLLQQQPAKLVTWRFKNRKSRSEITAICDSMQIVLVDLKKEGGLEFEISP